MLCSYVYQYLGLLLRALCRLTRLTTLDLIMPLDFKMELSRITFPPGSLKLKAKLTADILTAGAFWGTMSSLTRLEELSLAVDDMKLTERFRGPLSDSLALPPGLSSLRCNPQL